MKYWRILLRFHKILAHFTKTRGGARAAADGAANRVERAVRRAEPLGAAAHGEARGAEEVLRQVHPGVPRAVVRPRRVQAGARFGPPLSSALYFTKTP